MDIVVLTLGLLVVVDVADSREDLNRVDFEDVVDIEVVVKEVVVKKAVADVVVAVVFGQQVVDFLKVLVLSLVLMLMNPLVSYDYHLVWDA